MRRIAAAISAIALTALGLVVVPPAAAATENEIVGAWDDAPASVAAGSTLASTWKINVNDDQAAPNNDVVPNVTVTLVATNSRFSTMPTLCRTDITPASTLSVDRRTATCNLGDQVEGSALTMNAAVTADGLDGSEASITGNIGSASATLAGIPITATFSMDTKWNGVASSWIGPETATTRQATFHWAITTGTGLPAGPDSVTYTIATTNLPPNSTLTCRPHDMKDASDYPNSSPTFADGTPVPANQQAPYVGSCDVTRSGQTLTMTVTGIDYSKTLVPTRATRGGTLGLLPTDRQVVATGVV